MTDDNTDEYYTQTTLVLPHSASKDLLAFMNDFYIQETFNAWAFNMAAFVERHLL